MRFAARLVSAYSITLFSHNHPRHFCPADIKEVYRNASFLSDNRVVFNIKGNRYRLVVLVKYTNGVVFIRFVGTHAEYDEIDVTTI